MSNLFSSSIKTKIQGSGLDKIKVRKWVGLILIVSIYLNAGLLSVTKIILSDINNINNMEEINKTTEKDNNNIAEENFYCKSELDTYLNFFRIEDYKKTKVCFLENDSPESNNALKLFHFRKALLEFNSPFSTETSLMNAKVDFKKAFEFGKKEAAIYLSILPKDNSEDFLLNYLSLLERNDLDETLVQSTDSFDSLNDLISINLNNDNKNISGEEKEKELEKVAQELVKKLLKRKSGNSALLDIQRATHLMESKPKEAAMIISSVANKTVSGNESKDKEKENYYFKIPNKERITFKIDLNNPSHSIKEFKTENYKFLEEQHNYNNINHNNDNNDNNNIEHENDKEGKEEVGKGTISFHMNRARQGHSSSQVFVGQLHHFGNLGIERNLEQARHYYLQAANQGEAIAFNNLAYMNLTDKYNANEKEENLENSEDGGNDDREGERTKEAISFLESGAKLDDANALFNLGNILLNGLYGQKKDEAKGLRLLYRAALKGNAEAYYRIGLYLLENGERLESMNEEEKVGFFSFLRASKFVKSGSKGGNEYEEKKRKAIYYFKESANLGFDQGKFTYASLLCFPSYSSPLFHNSNKETDSDRRDESFSKQKESKNTLSKEKERECLEGLKIFYKLVEKEQSVLSLLQRAENALLSGNLSASLLNYALLAKVGIPVAMNNFVGLLKTLENPSLLTRTLGRLPHHSFLYGHLYQSFYDFHTYNGVSEKKEKEKEKKNENYETNAVRNISQISRMLKGLKRVFKTLPLSKLRKQKEVPEFKPSFFMKFVYRNSFPYIYDPSSSLSKGNENEKDAKLFVNRIVTHKKVKNSLYKLYLTKLALLGSVRNLRILGDMMNEEGDIETALQSYTEASKKGDAQSSFALASMYLSGKSLPRNFEKAEKLLEKASSDGGGIAVTVLKRALNILSEVGKVKAKILGAKKTFTVNGREFNKEETSVWGNEEL